MSRKWIGAVLACMLFAMCVAPSWAHDYDRNDSGCWLRYAAHLLHPVGIALEYGVTRPLHALVSKPDLCILFGHEPSPGDEYYVWK